MSKAVNDWEALLVDWTDWKAVEGTRYHLKPALARSLTVTACETHFKASSIARAELEGAVDRINEVRNVGIAMKIRYAPHLNADSLYAHPPADTYRIEVTPVLPIRKDTTSNSASRHYRPLSNDNGGANAYVAHWIASEGYWDWGGDVNKRASDAVVLGIDATKFKCGACKPDSDDAPALGVISHEMGHSFHHGHRDERRGASKQRFESLTVWRGYQPSVGTSRNNIARTDARTGFVSAYSKALLETVSDDSVESLRQALGQAMVSDAPSGDLNWQTYQLMAGTADALPSLLQLSKTANTAEARIEIFEALEKEYQLHKSRRGD